MIGGWSFLLHNLVVASSAAVLVALFVRSCSPPARLERLLWIAVVVRLLLPPVLPVALPGLADATVWPIAGHVDSPTEAAPPVSPEADPFPIGTTRNGPPDVSEDSLERLAINALLALWLCGFLALLLFRVCQMVAWFGARSLAPAPPRLRRLTVHVARDLGMRAPRVVVDVHLAVPTVAGLVHPRLFWPAGLLDTVNEKSTRTLIAHEFAHVAHRDLWIGVLELIAGCVWWWYPGWYVIRQRLREACERACDERVVAAYPTLRREYADALLDVVARCVARSPALAAGLGERRNIRHRLRTIMTERRTEIGSGSRLLAATFLLVLIPSWTSAVSESDTEISTVATDPTSAAPQPSTPVAPQPSGPVAPQPSLPGAPQTRDGAATVARESSDPRQEHVPELLRRLASPDPDVRRHTVGTIGRARLRWAIPLIFPLAADTSARVRSQVASSIGLDEPPAGIPVLLDLLKDLDTGVRRSAAWALGEFERQQLEAADAVTPMLDAADDPDAGVRRQIAASLTLTAVDGGSRVLSSLLQDESGPVRATAVWGLGARRRNDLTEAVLPLAADPDPDVRRQVAWSIYMLPRPDWRSIVAQLRNDTDPDVRGTAALALGQIDAHANPGSRRSR